MSTVHFEIDDVVEFDLTGIPFVSNQLLHLGVPLFHLGIPLVHTV
jgi:hypothetical protein